MTETGSEVDRPERDSISQPPVQLGGLSFKLADDDRIARSHFQARPVSFAHSQLKAADSKAPGQSRTMRPKEPGPERPREGLPTEWEHPPELLHA